MTAVEQPRDAGGRFATKECPRVYALLDALAESVPIRERREGGYAVEAPRCPHGHFARWAARNCRPCR